MKNTDNTTTEPVIVPSNRLMLYHTSQCNPDYYWENNSVANKLKQGEINSYEEYKSACKSAGSSCYTEELYNQYVEYIKQLKAKYGEKVQY